MSAVKRISGLLGRVRAPFGRLAKSEEGPKDEDIIHAVIQRIEVEDERQLAGATIDSPEAMYRSLLRRLDWSLKKSGITPEELIRTYPGEVRAMLLFKSYEKSKKKAESSALKEKLMGLGFKHVQPGIWILPPTKTPPNLNSHDELRLWFRQQLSKKVGRSVDYVFPFVALVDLKKVVAERRGIRKMPTARTVYNVLSEDEVVPPSHLYATMCSRGMSAREVILSGDLPFLCSTFADKADLEGVRVNEAEIMQRLRHATGAHSINLVDIANLGPDTVASAVRGFVAHPMDLARRAIVEAQFWMRTLGGTVPP